MWDFDLNDFNLGFEDPGWSNFNLGDLGGGGMDAFDFGDFNWSPQDIPEPASTGPWGIDSLDLGSQVQVNPWTGDQNLDQGMTQGGLDLRGVDSVSPQPSPLEPTDFFMGESAPFSPTETDPNATFQARGISPEEAVYRHNAGEMTAGPGGGLGQKLIDLKNQAVSLVSDKTYQLVTGKTPGEIIGDLQNPNPEGAVRDIRALYPNYSQDFDKLEHAYASYLMANRLGYYPALGIGGLKELTDTLGTGFSFEDLLADLQGANISAGYRPSIPIR